MGGMWKTYLSAYWDEETKRCDATDKDISVALKCAARELDYPATRGIPIERIDTHSLRGGGANALSLNGYSDPKFKNWGGGKESQLKNTSVRSWQALRKECPRQ